MGRMDRRTRKPEPALHGLLGEGGARGGVAFEVGGRPGLGASSRGSTIAGGLETPCAGILGPSILVVDGYELVVGRVERGAFASALSGFGVVPVHPPLPLTRRGSGALRARAKPKKLPARHSPSSTDKVVSRVGRVRRFGWRACRFGGADFRHVARS